MKWFWYLVIIIACTMSLAGPIHGDIFFHTDIARDFLLIQDIVVNNKLTLIGPRAGGITGVFHGPLWLYLNSIPFLITHGNPATMSWFWYLLMIAALYFQFITAKKIFNIKIALISVSFLSILYIRQVNNFFNPYGALILTPLFFYYIYQKKHFLAFLVLGGIIQFQMAFGIPLLILSLPIILKRPLSIIGIIPGLSTFILFDIRHNFIQFKSVLNYLNQSVHQTDVYIPRLMSLVDSSNIFISSNIYLKILSLVLLIVSLILVYRKNKYFFKLFIYYYLGFWIISLFFGGTIQTYYYFQFTPLVYLAVSNLPIIVLIPIITFNLFNAYNQNINYTNNIIAKDTLSWQFYQQNLSSVINKEFSYYVYSQDQYGYSTKYAINYLDKQKYSHPYKKLPNTILFFEPEKTINSSINFTDWKTNKVKINLNPSQTISFDNGYKIEIYNLNKQELLIPSDPNLISNLFFR